MKTIPAFVTSLVLCCLIAAPAHADSVSSCVPDTSVASLQQSGGCESGGLLYSNFQYNNNGLQISPGVYVTPSNVLVTASPFGLIFSTDYGIDGGFTNCLRLGPFDGPGKCIEEEGTLGYDVTVMHGAGQIAGLGLFGGGTISGLGGGAVSEIGCLGTGNDAILFSYNLSSSDIPFVCPENPTASVLLHSLQSSGGSIALFPPVTSISVAIGLSVAPAEANPRLPPPHPSDVAPFSNVFLRVPEPSSLMLLCTGLLALGIIKLKKPIA
jgi:hypothetical protein